MPIVCAVDFSEAGAEAATAAAAIAKRMDGRVLLIHVHADLAETAEPGSVQAAAAARLAAEAERLRGLGATVDTELLGGHPDEVIVEYAHKVHARLIVLAATGERSGPKWRLGSVADRTAQSADVPVLVLRGARPFLDWTEGRRPLKILLGIDFSQTSDAALRWVGDLRRLAPCDVTAVFAYWPPGEAKRLGLHGQVDSVEGHPEVERCLIRDLKVKVGELAGGGAVEVKACMVFGRPADELVHQANLIGADLIVMGNHQRTGLARLWHGSVSQAVMHDADSSVVAVPTTAVRLVRDRTIPRLKSVLVTTDFSELGDDAIRYAYGVLPGGGVVHVVHVLEREALDFYFDKPASVDERRIAAELIARLKTLVPPDATGRGIETHFEVVEGRSVPSAICQAAERLAVDLIAISSHGRSGIAKTLVGSVAERVMLDARRPVLIVRRPPED